MPDTQPTTSPKSPLKGVLLVCIFVFILIAGFIFIPKFALPALNNARESARSVAGAKTLSSIGKTMILYADTAGNGGEYPTDAKQLFPAYINDERVFKRPGFPDAQDAHFMLVVGPKPTDTNMILGFEIPPPVAKASGRNVLQSDGQSIWMNEEVFKERLAQTEKKLVEANRIYKLVPMNRSSLKR